MEDRTSNAEKFFKEKMTTMKSIVAQKDRSMEFANMLNNAVLVWRTMVEFKLPIEEAQDSIFKLIEFFMNTKDTFAEKEESEPEVTVEDVKKEFPGSQEVTPSEEKPSQDPNTVPITEAQAKAIWAIANQLGYSPKQLASMVEIVLGLAKPPSIKALTKAQASKVIENLKKMLRDKK